MNENPPVIEDISDLLPEIPTNIAWNNTDNDNIFAFYPDKIYRINVNDKAIFPQDAAQLPEALETTAAHASWQKNFLLMTRMTCSPGKSRGYGFIPKKISANLKRIT